MTHIFILTYINICPVGLTPWHFPASCQNETSIYYSAKQTNLSHVWVSTLHLEPFQCIQLEDHKFCPPL